MDAASAWVIDGTDTDRPEEGGHAPLPVGQELVPAKRMFFLTAKELLDLPTRRQVPVRLGTDRLQARNVALLPFPPDAGT